MPKTGDRDATTSPTAAQTSRAAGTSTSRRDRFAGGGRSMQSLLKANRSLRTLGLCHQAVVRASTEAELLQDICGAIVDVGGYAAAWARLRYRGRGSRAAACAGIPHDAISERDEHEAAQAMRAAKPETLWARKGRHGGPRATLLLRFEDRVFGTLTVHGGRTDSFDSGEVSLLRQLADDTSFGIATLRLRRERDRAMQEKDKFADLDRVRNSVLSSVSHELRTPLAAVKGYSTLLLEYDRRLKAAEKREYLTAIEKAADRLNELVEQLLEMSRLDAGLFKMEVRPADLEPVLRAAVADRQRTTPDHVFELAIEPALPQPSFDTRRIRQVLDNLMDRAVKGSQPGTTISVAARRGDGQALVSVSDQGAGIPEKELARVFDRLYHVERGTARRSGDMGLGLALCKALVEKQGGRIWAESRAGEGNTFWFALPVSGGEEHV